MTLKEEIRKALTGLSTGPNGKIAAHVRFPRDFGGFRGHFPDLPVVPGVCLVQAAVALVEASQKRSFRLQRITSAKFFSVVSPEDDVAMDCEAGEEPAGTIKARALFHVGERKIADIIVRMVPADAKDGSDGAA